MIVNCSTLFNKTICSDCINYSHKAIYNYTSFTKQVKSKNKIITSSPTASSAFILYIILIQVFLEFTGNIYSDVR